MNLPILTENKVVRQIHSFQAWKYHAVEEARTSKEKPKTIVGWAFKKDVFDYERNFVTVYTVGSGFATD